MERRGRAASLLAAAALVAAIAVPAVLAEGEPAFEVRSFRAMSTGLGPLHAASLLSPARRDLIVQDLDPEGGPDDEIARSLSLYAVVGEASLTGEPRVRIELDPAELFYDVGRPANAPHEALFLLTRGAVLRFDTETGERVPVARLDSVFRAPKGRAIERLDFVRDLDGDGLDDLVVQDFVAIQVMLQSPAFVYLFEDGLLNLPSRTLILCRTASNAINVDDGQRTLGRNDPKDKNGHPSLMQDPRSIMHEVAKFFLFDDAV